MVVLLVRLCCSEHVMRGGAFQNNRNVIMVRCLISFHDDLGISLNMDSVVIAINVDSENLSNLRGNF